MDRRKIPLVITAGIYLTIIWRESKNAQVIDECD